MERLVLTLNGIGPAREVREGARAYVVAPGTLIVEGVLPGSKGPLFYPAPEIKSSAATWNGTLITLGHPTDPDTGTHLSAKSPGVADRLGMGVLRNSRFDGSLRADLWFDVAKTERIDSTLAANVRILPRLRQGKPIELSTGLFTRNDPAPLGATHNGRAYTHVARNYRPDHLAVLVDQVGACSLSMGCGVLVNQAHKFDWPDVFNAKKLSGGRWVTTDAGNRIYIKGGKPVAGNPKVLAAAKKDDAPKKDSPAKKAPEKESPKKDAPKKDSAPDIDDATLDRAVKAAHAKSGCAVGGGKGKCSEVSVSLWDELGRPEHLTPHGVSLSGGTDTDHVVLLDKRSGRVIDPTAYQYGLKTKTTKADTGWTGWRELDKSEADASRRESIRFRRAAGELDKAEHDRLLAELARNEKFPDLFGVRAG